MLYFIKVDIIVLVCFLIDMEEIFSHDNINQLFQTLNTIKVVIIRLFNKTIFYLYLSFNFTLLLNVISSHI